MIINNILHPSKLNLNNTISKSGTLGSYHIKLLDPDSLTFERSVTKSVFHRRSQELQKVCKDLSLYKQARMNTFLERAGIIAKDGKHKHLLIQQEQTRKLHNTLVRLGIDLDRESIVELVQLQDSIDLWKRTNPTEVKQRGSLLAHLEREITERIQYQETKQAIIAAIKQDYT